MNFLLDRWHNSIKPRVLVIGDLILDRYIWGEIERISPEAPVQILAWEKESSALGGAANVANNLAQLGCNVYLSGIIGYDSEGDELLKKAKQFNINTSLILKTRKFRTITKTRFISKNQHVLRVDKENNSHIDLENKFIKRISSFIEKIDGIICSDYSKGVFTEGLLRYLSTTSKKKKIKIVVDPKGNNYKKYQGVTAITPNISEFSIAVGKVSKKETELDQDVKKLLKNINVEFILLTRGKNGMTLFDRKGRIGHEPANAKEIFDVTGAGDTATAVFTMGLLGSSTLKDTLYLSNLSAGIVVGKVGTSTLTGNELKDSIGNNQVSFSNKIIPKDKIASVINNLRIKGKKIVFTNGCFDILHSGHIEYLERARGLGDILIVGLNSDSSVKRLKGQGRPFNQQKERAKMLASLSSVNLVSVFHEDTPLKLIQNINPDILTKGGDYSAKEIVGAKFVEENGGYVQILPFVEGISTTGIVKGIVQKHNSFNFKKKK